MAGGGCGTCTASENPTVQSYANTSTFTIGDSSRVWKGKWSQASFPSVPCPSPQNIIFEWFNGSIWKGAGGVGSGLAVELTTASSTVTANAGSWYTKSVIFNIAGTWPLRIHMVCGTTFISASINQVVVAASVGAPKILTTPASVI